MDDKNYADCEYCYCSDCDEFDTCEVGQENCSQCDLLGPEACDECFIDIHSNR